MSENRFRVVLIASVLSGRRTLTALLGFVCPHPVIVPGTALAHRNRQDMK